MRVMLKATIPIFTIYLLMVAVHSTDKPFDCSDFRCWDGIVVGETTLEEAEMLLVYVYGRQNIVIYKEQYYQVYRHLVWYSGNSTSGEINANGQSVVDEIYIIFGNPPPRLIDIIDRFGEPTSAYVSAISPCTTELALQYNGVNTWIYRDENGSDIQPQQPIEFIHMLSPQLSITRPLPDYLIRFDWQGYVDYCEMLEAQLP